jgi:hypothetical protein
MKNIFFCASAIIILASCTAPRQTAMYSVQPNNLSDAYLPSRFQYADTVITESLFVDKQATISEENIQKILSSKMALPEKLRIAIVKLETPSRYYNWSDEEYIKLQQLYIDKFTTQLKTHPKVEKVSVMPGLLAGRNPSVSQIREVAVRMQADMTLIFTTASDVYSKYRLFNKPNVKAFATTQLILMDTRTGLVPFTEIITRDFLSEKTSADADIAETRNRALREAVQLTINELNDKLLVYLNQNR